MRNWKLRNKMMFLFFLCFLVMLFSVGLNTVNEYHKNQNSLKILDQNLRENFDENIKNQVQTMLCSIDIFYQKYRSGEMTLEEAKKGAAEIIRNARYGKEGYFWADTVDGVNVVLYGSKIEGTSRWNYQDMKGKYIVQEIIRVALQGGGYSDYYFAKEGESNPQPKRAYSFLYKPFQWVIGTGIYNNDVDRIISEKQNMQLAEMKKDFLQNASIIMAFFLCVLVFLILIARSMSEPMQFAVDYAQGIANGNYTGVMPKSYLRRKDEIGSMANALLKMQDSIANSIYEKELSHEQLLKEKDFLNTVLVTIEDGILVLDEAGKILMANNAAIAILKKAEDDLLDQYHSDVLELTDRNGIRYPENLIDQIIRSGQSAPRRESYLVTGEDLILIEESASPIKDQNKQLNGIVYIFRDITEIMVRQKEIEFLSYHDQLTGLYNRRCFEEESKKLVEERRFPISVIVSDLNALKLTNDAFGHLVGDQLIVSYSNVLKNVFREKDLVYRIGGDEFAVLLPDTPEKEAKNCILRVRKELEHVKVDQIPVTAAFGVGVVTENGNSLAEVFRHADEAMYKQKLSDYAQVKRAIINQIILANYENQVEKRAEIKCCTTMMKKFMLWNKMDQAMTQKMLKLALVHDIGNITVRPEILNKVDNLTSSDWTEIKTHPVSGYHILKNIDQYAEVAEYVLTHHEWYNGSGYPRGISGKKIPMESRMLALVSDYAAMTANRSYRNALTRDEAISILKSDRGRRYDPELLESFLKFLELEEEYVK